MKKEIIFLTVLDSFDSHGFYSRISAEYRKKHGHYAFIDRKSVMSDEVQKIAEAGDRNYSDNSKVYLLIDIFGFDAEQVARFYSASRALRRWYEATSYECIPDDALLDRLWKFVTG